MPEDRTPAPDDRPDQRDRDPLPSERVAAEETADAEAGPQDPAAEKTEREWWDDPRMPWKGKPGRWDLVCWFGIVFMGLYGLAMLPLRPYLVVANPVLQAGLTGSRSALVVLGVLNHPLWVLGLVLGVLSLLKFPWVYFLAGRLWGRGLLDLLLANRGKRYRRIADRVEAFARRYGVLALVVSYLPIPLPLSLVVPVLGIAGMRWRTFWITQVACAVVLQSAWVALGFWLGEPARVVVEAYARIAMYVAIGLLVVVVGGVVIRQRRQGGARPPAAPDRQ